MNLKVTVTGPRRLADRARAATAAIRLRLARDLREELQSADASDPEARRDALERAVRRI